MPVSPAHKIREARGALEGERKQVTVMFADVAGSTELIESRDAEFWRATMEQVFEILCAGVHRFEGTVDKFTGDGILALFGAPVAHEDHAQRACLAALHLMRELDGYRAKVAREHGVDLALRLGLHSGEVIFGAIGEDLAVEYTAIGHAVALAKRMESLAAPGSTYMTGDTAALVEGFFEVADLGEQKVKGASVPVRVFELRDVGTAAGRVDAQRARGLSSFVGREEEMEAVERALERGLAGPAEVVGVVGDAGVGKSRLCHEFSERCRERGIPVYRMVAQAHGGAVPLLPVIEMLRSYFEITSRDPGEMARERITERLLALGGGLEDELGLMLDFLGVADPEEPLPAMDPEARQRRLLSLMGRLARAQSAHEPSVVILEDLHWLDDASAAFVANHVDAIQDTRGLAVATMRPNHRTEWMARSYYRQIPLAPLTAPAVGSLLSGLLGDDPSLDGLADLIIERTEGNPLFVEELVRSLIETGHLQGERGSYRLVRALDRMTVPASVHAVLSARIDRLAPYEKEVLQAAAVVGREIPAPVLERVVDLDPGVLEEALAGLRHAELLYEHQVDSEAVYVFKHALTQDVAYESQLSDRRRRAHAAVAQALADHHADHLEERAALIAGHWEQAGELLTAAQWRMRAAVWAGFNEPVAARRHWRHVQALTDALPPSPEQQELGLSSRAAQLSFGWRMGLGEGQTLEEFELEIADLHREATAMAEKAEIPAVSAVVLSEYGAARGLCGHLGEMLERCLGAVELAREMGEPALEISLRVGAGTAHFLLGSYPDLESFSGEGIALAGGDENLGGGLVMPCPHAWHLMMHAVGPLYRARLPDAVAELEHSAAVARRHGDIETEAWVHEWLAYAVNFAGEDPEKVLWHGQEALRCAEHIGSSLSLTTAHIAFGFACMRAERWADAAGHLEASIAIGTGRGVGRVFTSIARAHLASAQLGGGAPAQARSTAELAIEEAVEFGAKSFELEGRLALIQILYVIDGDDVAALLEDQLQRSLDLIEETGATTFSARVHLDLAELARLQGDEARRERETELAMQLYRAMGAGLVADRVAVQVG